MLADVEHGEQDQATCSGIRDFVKLGELLLPQAFERKEKKSSYSPPADVPEKTILDAATPLSSSHSYIAMYESLWAGHFCCVDSAVVFVRCRSFMKRVPPPEEQCSETTLLVRATMEPQQGRAQTHDT